MYGVFNFSTAHTVLNVQKDGNGKSVSTEAPCPCHFCSRVPPVPRVQHLNLFAQPPGDAPAQEALLVIDWEADALQIRYRVPAEANQPDAHRVTLKDGSTAWFRWSSALAKFVDVDALLKRAGWGETQKVVGEMFKGAGLDVPGISCGCHFCKGGDQRPEVQHLKVFLPVHSAHRLEEINEPTVELFLDIDWSTKRLAIRPKL